MQQTTSKDGTTIAFDQTGSGPAVIIVAAALADRSGTTGLAKQLAPHFTVINYDRRGRGNSTDTPPYAIEREIEDIDALLDCVGGGAYVFGSSSGSVLALEAANRLGARVKKLFMYEPPFIIDSSHPPVPETLAADIRALVAEGRRNDAVKMFFAQGMGIPGFAVTLMRWFMPGWSKMTAVAQTVPYDLAVLAGTQSGQPLPAQRWTSVTAPTRVVVGSKSEAFFHSGAQALVDLLPNAEYRSLEGKGHGAVLMAPAALAAAMVEFFTPQRNR
jgi:pimeloyl-ACP methyl ester carboxylesterase